MTRKVTGLIRGQGTYLGFRFGPWSGHWRQLIDVALSVPSFLSKILINIFLDVGNLTGKEFDPRQKTRGGGISFPP